MRRMGLSAVSSIIGHFKGEIDMDMVINKDVIRTNR
jgi:hypothetical protein